MIDVDNNTRIRINPPSDWNETEQQSPAYIANKPNLGTVAVKNVAEDINQTQDIPTSRQVYDAIREVSSAVETLKSQIGKPSVAKNAVDMVDRTSIYIYAGSETGYTKGHWYYYDGSTWADGGAYNTAVITTDNTLLVEGEPADAKATGTIVFKAQNDIVDLDERVDTSETKRSYNIDLNVVNHELIISEI